MIKIGDFWLVENGQLFKVTQLPTENNTCYVGNKIGPYGFILGIGVSKSNFEKKLTKRTALGIAIKIIKDKFFS